jgi:peptidylprolyl isomerase/FKBP-type peptidyl-prolyl cis-trans isomerase FklB
MALALGGAACARTHADPKVAAAGKAFLAQNAHAPGVQVTASGLQYKVLTSGPASGPTPKGEDQVKVNYEGKLLDGSVFDSSYQRGQPAVFGVNGLIPAWTEALQLMHPGDVWELYAPANLAYGDEGAGPIPPGSVLEFKLELLAINPPDGGS